MAKYITIKEDSLRVIKESMVGSSNTASHNTVCVMEARPEVDEFELGQESDNPPVGGNYCHVNESNVPREFIERAFKLRPDGYSNWVVIDLVDINRMPRYFQKKSAAYFYYKWLRNTDKNAYKPVIINLDKEISPINEIYSNTSVRGDMDKVDYIDYVPHDNAREEGYTVDNMTEFTPHYELMCYGVDGDVIFSGELTLNELFDYFPDRIIHMMSNREGRKVSQSEYRIEDILSWNTKPNNIDDVEEVNAIAKRIQPGGPSAYLLVDGDVISFLDHIQITSIEGMSPSKFVGLGNIRVGVGGNGIEVSKEPTREQISVLMNILRGQDEVFLDIVKDEGKMYPETICYAAYKNVNPNRVINDIIYYFQDGVRPQGTMAYESKRKYKNLIENIDFEVNSSDIDLSSFKKKKQLAPIWNEQGELNPRIRLKLLDIADDFWEFVNLKWVKPSGIILTGSICNFNWSKFSDIDLHLIVDFDEIDEKTEFVRDYLDAKKNEWNNEHEDLKILDYPVELYVQNLEEMPKSGGIYDLEENDWIKKPNADDIKSIGLNKFSIKDKAANIMTIIDDMYDALNSTSDSYEIEQIGDDAKYLWKKVKNMRKDSLQVHGENGSGNIVYKILRRTNYLEKLWKLSTIVYDKFNSITESVESSIIKEYLDKDYSLPLYKYFKWAETASDKEKVENVFYNCPNFIEYYLEEINGNYEILDEFLEKVYQNASIINDKNFINQLVNAIDELGLSENALEYLESTIDPEEQPSWMIMSLIEIVKNRWCIHFTNNANDAYNIAKNGFTKGVKNINFLAYTINREKNSPGYDFAFLLDDNELNFNSFGNGAVIFRTNGVLTYHEEDASSQVVFWGPNVKEMIPIEKDQNSASWMIKGANGKVLKSGTPSELAAWVDNNFVQYRNQIATKSLYYNESIKKYITLLKENLINEEVVADGNSEHNPYEKRWKAERKALKDFICNFGKIMTSRENGKQYKVYYDKVLSQLIGYNYCICLQWDPIQLKPSSTLYIRALDKFTNKVFQAQYDTRGRDNQLGTADDLRYGNQQQNNYQYQ